MGGISGRFDELLANADTQAALGLSSALASTLNSADGGGGNRSGSSEKEQEVEYNKMCSNYSIAHLLIHNQ